jgi:hypothetical protein
MRLDHLFLLFPDVKPGDVARRVGKTPSWMSKIKKGSGLPSLPMAFELSDALGGMVHPDEMALAPISGDNESV